MFEPLGTKLLGRQCWANTCRADTLRRFLIWILDFWIFLIAFWDVMGSPMNGTGKNEQKKKEKHRM